MAVRTVEDAEKIRELMIKLEQTLGGLKGKPVLKDLGVKAQIRNIALNNTSSTYPVVKGWIDELHISLSPAVAGSL